MKKFKEWLKLKETTDTGQIASFARPVMGMQRRMFPKPMIMKKGKK